MAEQKRPRISKELLKPPKGPGVPLIKKPKPLSTFKIEGSPTLSQVKSFLPSLAKANETLDQRIKSAGNDKFDIEHVSDSQTKHIQVELQLIPLEDSDSDSDNDAMTIRDISLPNNDNHNHNRKIIIEELK